MGATLPRFRSVDRNFDSTTAGACVTIGRRTGQWLILGVHPRTLLSPKDGSSPPQTLEPFLLGLAKSMTEASDLDNAASRRRERHIGNDGSKVLRRGVLMALASN
jgi:hypothetical protein